MNIVYLMDSPKIEEFQDVSHNLANKGKAKKTAKPVVGGVGSDTAGLAVANESFNAGNIAVSSNPIAPKVKSVISSSGKSITAEVRSNGKSNNEPKGKAGGKKGKK